MAEQLPPGFQIDQTLSQQMGTTVAVNPQTGKRIRWNPSAGANLPQGTTPRPEYGAGAYETSDGAILKQGQGGKVQTLRGPQTAGAEARVRLGLGIGPVVEAQKRMYQLEGWKPPTDPNPRGKNPMDTFGGKIGNVLADMADQEDPPIPRSILTSASKSVGGKNWAEYQQAAKTFEAAFLPILSGASVTASEAARQFKANLPEPGDSPAILAQKSKQRAMMINGAARLLGEKPPFPRIPTMDLTPYVEGGRESVQGGGTAGPSLVIDINGNVLK